MQKKKDCLLAACLAVLVPAAAVAGTGPYIAADLGIAAVRDSGVTDSTVPGVTVVLSAERGMAFDVAVGYDFGKPRIEAEVAYQKNDLDAADFGIASLSLGGDVSSLAVLVNGYYDFETGSPITPFLTVGFGIAKVDINDFSVPASGLPAVSDSDTEAAYQFGAGLGYQVSDRVTIDFAYRYFGTADLKFDTTRAEYSSHRFTAGVRVSF